MYTGTVAVRDISSMLQRQNRAPSQKAFRWRLAGDQTLPNKAERWTTLAQVLWTGLIGI
jgi:hypothetical protein